MSEEAEKARLKDASYMLLEWDDNSGCYYLDFESDGVVIIGTLEQIKERKKNLEASKDFDSENNSLDIFKLDKLEAKGEGTK